METYNTLNINNSSIQQWIKISPSQDKPEFLAIAFTDDDLQVAVELEEFSFLLLNRVDKTLQKNNTTISNKQTEEKKKHHSIVNNNYYHLKNFPIIHED